MQQNINNLPPILTIAGSDSGGGAGIQADLKTIQALGGYGMSAITAITAQNTEGVFGVQEVSLEIIRQQIELVLSDIGASAIKTGMLASAEIIETVVDSLKGFCARDNIPPPVGGRLGGGRGEAESYNAPLPTSPLQGEGKLVVDPVMIAKGGVSLLKDDAVETLVRKLLPLATVVTPNIQEAERLSGVPIKEKNDMLKAARRVLTHGVQAVIIKGGHLDTGDGLVHNLLVGSDGLEIWQSSPRINTRNTHGTGCTFSAALATLLGRGFSLQESFAIAEAYVAGAIAHAPDLGKGHGPLNHSWKLSGN